MVRLAMLGTGFIARFYTQTVQARRSADRVEIVCGRDPERTRIFAEQHGIARWTTDLTEAVQGDEVDAVVVALPNDLHEPAVLAAAAAGRAVLCTKPLGRSAQEAQRMLEAVERAGVFHAYLEDLVYPPKTQKALQSVGAGAIGDVLWVRSREAHPGPHSDWFWDRERSGGGAIIDMGCHCIEIARRFIGRDIRPVDVMCWADTLVHPIEAEDHAIGLVRYENGAIGQFEVSWAFRGGMDLRDEVAGTDGTIWLNHWLRTGVELFTATGQSDYVAEKAESETGWLFPVGDESSALGYTDMFADVFSALESGRPAQEDFYDGFVVNAIMDAAYRSAESRRWEAVDLPIWRGRSGVPRVGGYRDYDAAHILIKEEKLPDGTTRVILREKQTGRIIQRSV